MGVVDGGVDGGGELVGVVGVVGWVMVGCGVEVDRVGVGVDGGDVLLGVVGEVVVGVDLW